MDKLFIKTENANEPISEDMISKYNLKKGMRSPFTNSLIVDMNGNSNLEHQEKARITDVEESQIIYTTSEILG